MTRPFLIKLTLVAGCSAAIVAMIVRLETVHAQAPPAKATETAKADPAPEAKSGESKAVPIHMFGVTPSRNMVNPGEKGLPGKFDLEENVKWKATLGSRSYGLTVGNGKVLCGTNNENPRNPRDRFKAAPGEELGLPIDRGIVMAFDAKDGKFAWQAVHDKLPSGMVNDWPREGICSTPTIEEDRAYYVSNRCAVVCVTTEGLVKGNVGFAKEKYQTPLDADIVWEYDMIKELGVFPHNMTCCSPLVVGDLIFVVSANGVDEGHINIPAPEAPSFICLDKKTGKLVWKDSSPGRRIMHGQWSNPSYGVIHGKPTVIFPGGDGWIYAFEPSTGKSIWKFDANPKGAKYELGGKGTKSDFIGSPVIHDNRVYIGTGQDPEHFEGIGHFWCIEPTKTGDISPEIVTDASVDPPATKPNPDSGAVWHFGGDETRPQAKRDFVFSRTMSTACIVDDVIYIAELAGYLHCVDLKTGKPYWQFDTKSQIWGSAYYADGKVYLGNEDGDLFVFKHSKDHPALDETELASKEKDAKAANAKRLEVRKQVAKEFLIAKVSMEEPIRSTPVAADGVLYVMTEKSIFAVVAKKE